MDRRHIGGSRLQARDGLLERFGRALRDRLDNAVDLSSDRENVGQTGFPCRCLGQGSLVSLDVEGESPFVVDQQRNKNESDRP
jgi:hypothetical protein